MQVQLLLSVRFPRSKEISSHLSTLQAPDPMRDHDTYKYMCIIAPKSYPPGRRARSAILRCHSPMTGATITPFGRLPPKLCTTSRSQKIFPSHAQLVAFDIARPPK